MSERELLLGRDTHYDQAYSPDLLHPLPRSAGRARLGLGGDGPGLSVNGLDESGSDVSGAGVDRQTLPFTGWDIWNGYELSWLDPSGKPLIAWGEFRIPAESPSLVESKSFKLYLNSLNQHRFDDVDAASALMAADLARCVGSDVAVRLRLPADWPTTVVQPAGSCLDDLPLAVDRYQLAPELLRAGDEVVHETLFSRLLRSRCPVTGQPDWGTVSIDYRGPAIDRAGLLAYLVSFRLHQGFHEECVERIFVDILRHCRPTQLTVGARYLRRGGLDINPWRSTTSVQPENTRLFQQ